METIMRTLERMNKTNYLNLLTNVKYISPNTVIVKREGESEKRVRKEGFILFS